ncbi:hypothetical protein T07_4331 [Trichinella nelsoni]|uniref:Uncharacterized protein n=1 Tax=Trichinella nelsoni TaxID=6336 RepID=A0A0V0RK86_9BILA|nr:hypothetical protein T07_4331 [Trichinella nelsoni]
MCNFFETQLECVIFDERCTFELIATKCPHPWYFPHSFEIFTSKFSSSNGTLLCVEQQSRSAFSSSLQYHLQFQIPVPSFLCSLIELPSLASFLSWVTETSSPVPCNIYPMNGL